MEGLWRRYCKPPESPRCARAGQLRESRWGILPRCALHSSITDQGLVHVVGTPRSTAIGDELRAGAGRADTVRFRSRGHVVELPVAVVPVVMA